MIVRGDKIKGVYIRRHGFKGTKIYSTWNSMLSRLKNKNVSSYSRYGGRGIGITSRWLIFENFMKDMGVPLPGQSLDRINNNGNYCRSNCRWVDGKTQQNNRSSNRFVEYNSEIKTISQWSEELGIPQDTLKWRLNRWGENNVKCFELPVGRQKNNRKNITFIGKKTRDMRARGQKND